LHQGAPLAASPVEYDARDPTSQIAVRIDEQHAPAVPDILQGERLKQRRAADASLRTKITAYLEAGGTLENAQAMAAHESRARLSFTVAARI
jgi:hypothetical protein